MSIVTTDNRFYSEIAAAIREKNGESTLYLPADMAEAILAIKGGGDAYAAISVTYPEGSVCTCTQPGQTPLTAGDTSGAWLFLVPVGGEWTIECHNTATSESTFDKVNIQKQYAIASLSLSYDYVLFDRTTTSFADITSNMVKNSAISFTDYSDELFEIIASGSSNVRGSYNVPLPADLSAYTALEIYGYQGTNDARNKVGVTNTAVTDANDTWIAQAVLPLVDNPVTTIPLQSTFAGKYFTFRINASKHEYIKYVKLVK